MGKIDIAVNPIHIRFRNKETKKMKWMRCREYAIHGDRVSVTIIKKGHALSEWLSLNEWEIEKTDAPETTPQPVYAPAPVSEPLAFTPRGSENPNAPKSAQEALARRDDFRKAGALTVELPGEYNAWAHLNKKDALEGKVVAGPEDVARLRGSIEAEATRQEAMRRMSQQGHKLAMIASMEQKGVGFEP